MRFIIYFLYLLLLGLLCFPFGRLLAKIPRGSDHRIRRTIQAGANTITYTPPTAQELFKITMAKYREM